MEFIFTFLLLLLDFWAIVNVAQSPATRGTKIAWSIAIVVFPFAGLVAWYLMGPKARIGYA